MTLVNTTFAVEPQTDPQLRRWITGVFFKDATEKGGFTAPLFSRILGADSDCAASYAVQMQCESLECAKIWFESGDGARLLRSLRHEHGDSVVWFTTYMEIIK